MANHAHSTPAPKAHRPPSLHQRRRTLETALERLLSAAQAVVEDLDALDGDPDLEPSLSSLTSFTAQDSIAGTYESHVDLEEECEDEGAACEDEGVDSDSEPDQLHRCLHYGLDQRTPLRQYS